MMSDRARILAQLAEHGRPMSTQQLAESMGAEDMAPVAADLDRLIRDGLARRVRALRHRGWFFEPTERGRLEAAGGAQLRIDGAPDRPPMHVQPALF